MEESMDRRRAHQLIDRLDTAQLDAFVGLLKVMVEPRAPVEEDEITPDTAAAPDRVRASLVRGESIPHEEVLREFGSQ
jgi:hypothetical protein